MSRKISVIGAGNMGGAIVAGMIDSGLFDPSKVSVANSSNYRLDELQKRFPEICCYTDNLEAVKNADIVILAVKPNCFAAVCESVKDYIRPDVVVVSIGAGVRLSSLKGWLGNSVKIVRAMPNIAALVGESMSVLAGNSNVGQKDMQDVRDIFDSFGSTQVMSESQMDAVTALSGSSPAYIFILIEALADGAVLKGIPREIAYSVAAQTVLGSAKLMLDTGKHPAELKDMVCSPGGTTIAAVSSLESSGFRSSIIEAVRVCAERSEEIAKESE